MHLPLMTKSEALECLQGLHGNILPIGGASSLSWLEVQPLEAEQQVGWKKEVKTLITRNNMQRYVGATQCNLFRALPVTCSGWRTGLRREWENIRLRGSQGPMACTETDRGKCNVPWEPRGG